MNSFYQPLVDFWGLGRIRISLRERLYLEQGKMIFKNGVLRFEFADALKPEWLNKDMPTYVYCGSLYENKSRGKVLAEFCDGDKRYPAIVINADGRIVYNFNIQETLDSVIHEQYRKIRRPVASYVPLSPQKLIPRSLRKTIKRALTFFSGSKNGNAVFPKWPVESTVELFRSVFLNSLNLASGGQLKVPAIWPNNKKFALLLTHDVDSLSGLLNVRRIAGIEERHRFFSTWFIPATEYKIDFNILDSLVDKGHQLGLHGDRHDNRIAFLPEDMIRRRLDSCLRLIKKYDIEGFRSPSLFRSKQLFNVLADYFLYDSSVPDTAKLSPQLQVNGACTVFPYSIGKLMEIPITLPLDSSLIFLGYNPQGILDLWKDKIKWIKAVGGLAVIVTHPESHFIADPEYLAAYEKLLNWLSQDSDFWFTHPAEVARWWKTRSDNFL